MIKIRDIKIEDNTKTEDGRIKAVMEMFTDDKAELPAVDHFFGYLLTMGSMAYTIRTGQMFVLDSTGAWCEKVE